MFGMDGIIEGYLEHSIFLAYIMVFIGGVLTSFTPCIYPIIPITVGVLGSQEKTSKFHAFVLSMTYILGLSIVYSILGVIASLTGQFFGALSTNKWTFFISANIIMLFGLSMLGVFTFPNHVFLQKLNLVKKKSGVPASFFMGMTSGFIAAPCTTPVLGSLLIYVATRQNVLVGSTLMLVFTLGMSMLLLVIGTFTGIITALPRSGVWMVKVKNFMGYFLIVVGEYFLIQAGKVWK